VGYKNLTLEQKVQRSLDYIEIQNIMGKHAFYHAAGKHHEELEDIWAKKHELIWTGKRGSWVGTESFKTAYDTYHRKSDQANLERVIKLHPEIENKEENWGIGTLILHTLTTPIIEVAEDGQTAKGVWYSPGIMSEIGYDGKPAAHNMWERYGVDFVKEDDDWKIWHVHTYYDATYEPGKSWTDPPPQTPPPSMPHNDIGPKLDKPVTVEYKAYSPTTVPQMLPELPKPYKTFSDVMPY
jgi:hypothetical protein